MNNNFPVDALWARFKSTEQIIRSLEQWMTSMMSKGFPDNVSNTTNYVATGLETSLERQKSQRKNLSMS